MSDKLCNVQTKISCCFDTVVIEEPSAKRSFQSFRVVAGDTLRVEACESSISTAHVTEKIDGTCVYIAEFQGKHWLWARHDRKPNKAAEKRFKKYQNSRRAKSKDQDPQNVEQAVKGDEQFVWNVEKDFKEVPENWIPADGVPLKDDIPQPDKGGHIPGWVPVVTTSRQHCWHLSSVDLQQELGIFLQPKISNDGRGDSPKTQLEIAARPLKDFVGCTLELIGTNINGNPYSIGSKQAPVHFLVRHGVLSLTAPPPLDYVKIKDWFNSDPEGQIEGIVWHCPDGKMYKLHRHHLDLKWPISQSRIQTLTVEINVKGSDFGSKSQFELFSKIDGKIFDNIENISLVKDV